MIQSVVGKEGKRRGNGGEEVEETEGKGDGEVARKGKSVGGSLGGLLAVAGPGARSETHTITYPLRLVTTDTHE